jgi:hypothetical protein
MLPNCTGCLTGELVCSSTSYALCTVTPTRRASTTQPSRQAQQHGRAHARLMPAAGEEAPATGYAHVSYSRFLHLLHQRMIKRVVVYGRGKLALIEIPQFGWGHDLSIQRYDKTDFLRLYTKEKPWEQQVSAFYWVHLPGDFWSESGIAQAMHRYLPQRTGDGCATPLRRAAPAAQRARRARGSLEYSDS